MNATELKNILELHLKWLKREDGGARANLREANLRGADLRWADLSGADLRWADLREADLRWADLSGAIGNMLQVRSMQIEAYSISWTDDILNIGCKSYLIDEWRNFSDEEISKMDEGALEWWCKWKDIIFMAIDASKK
jgi:hypothetical protein